MPTGRLKALLVKLGLCFERDADERLFEQSYVLGKTAESQLFLILFCVFYYTFFVWDRVIDPVHIDATHMIRGLVVVPYSALAALLLRTAWGRERLEAIVLSVMFAGLGGLVAIYAILDRGYENASLGFFMMLMGFSSVFPIRARFLIPASLVSVAMVVGGHLYADNARPGWLIANMMAIGGGIAFGALSAYIRERGARQQFVTAQELAAARERVDDLLHSMLPSDIVGRIQAGETAIADAHGEVSIIFADLVGFTEMSRKISPSHLLKVLNHLFSAFDIEAEKLGIERIKTIGDAYMAIGGLTRKPGEDHAQNAAAFAFALQSTVAGYVQDLGYPLAIRVGLHIGPVVAGVIGVRRPAYDCWGEAVNLASRLETMATPGSIVISESAYWRLRPAFEIDSLDDTELKGIGRTKIYRLKRERAVPLLESATGQLDDQLR